MSHTYAVIFKGEILPGHEPHAVQQAIGKLFKADANKLATLFSGQPVAIKKNIDAATADKFVAAFAKAGAKAYARDMAAPNQTPAPAAPTAAPPAAAPPAATPPASQKGAPVRDPVQINPDSAATLRDAPRTVVDIQPQSSVDELSVREPGGFLVDPQAPEPTPPPEALHADLAPEGSTIPAPAHDTTPPPEPGDWELSNADSPSSGKASFSLDP